MEEMGPSLDPALWRQLPVDLMKNVLRKLPLKSLLLFRSVCCEWRSMIDSSQVVYDGPPGKPVISYHHPGGILETEEFPSRPFLAFPDCVTSRWEKHTLHFGECDNIALAESENVLVASDGGLLCFSRIVSPEVFTIYNPLTKKWRELKPPSPMCPELPLGLSSYDWFFRFILVGLTVDQDTGNYTLVVAGIHEGGPRETQIYESARHAWKTSVPVSPMPKTLPNGEWNATRGIRCNGNIYWHVSEHDGNDHVIQALLKFDLKLENWTFVKQSFPSGTPAEFHVVSHQGVLLLLDWSGYDYTDENISLPALELLMLGSEVRLMNFSLGKLDNFYNPWKPFRGIGVEDELYILHVSSGEEEDIRVLVYGKSVWLPKWEALRDEMLFYAFAPTLRAYV